MVIAFFQYIAAGSSWLLMKIFLPNFTIEGKKNLLDIQLPLIVVSNHESHLDPQLLGIALLSKPQLFPLRYMTKHQLFFIPGFNFLIWVLGAFPIVRGKGLHNNIQTAFKILRKNGTVIIFPEGKIFSERGVLGKGKRGAAALGIITRAQILPMTVHTPDGLTPLRFFFTFKSNKKAKITIGEPFYFDNTDYPDISDETLDKATRLIMTKIHSLYTLHQYD